MVNNTLASAGDISDASSFPGAGRSPGGEHDNPLPYSCLENPVDRGVRRLQSIRSHRVGHDLATEHTHTNIYYTEHLVCNRPSAECQEYNDK